MSVDDSRLDAWREMQARHAASRGEEQPRLPLQGGSGGGTYDGGMEARVARLESDMEHVRKGVDKLEIGLSDVKKTVSDIRVDIGKGVGEINTGIAKLDERSKHFTTRWDVILMLAAVVGILGAIVALAVRFIPTA